MLCVRLALLIIFEYRGFSQVMYPCWLVMALLKLYRNRTTSCMSQGQSLNVCMHVCMYLFKLKKIHFLGGVGGGVNIALLVKPLSDKLPDGT